MIRNAFCLCLLLVTLAVAAYAEYPWTDIKPEVVAKYPNSDKGISSMQGDFHEIALTRPAFVLGARALTIFDPIDGRIVTLDDSYKIASSVGLGYPRSYPVKRDRFFAFGSTIVIYDEEGYDLCDDSGKFLFQVDEHRGSDNPRSLFLYRNVLFANYNQTGFASYVLTGDRAKPSRLDTSQTRALFADNSPIDLAGLTLDDKNRLFLDGDLVTMDYDTFIEYFAHEKGNASATPPAYVHVDLAYALLRTMHSNEFVGRDASGNWYWRSNGYYLLVMNKLGWLIAAIQSEDKDIDSTAVAPNGDIYSLRSDDTWVYLERFENTWDLAETGRPYDPAANRDGVLNATGVRVRLEPNTSAAILTMLHAGTRVAILDQTSAMETISGLTARWLKVRLSDGTVGWVFGAYVDSGE